MFKPYEEKRFSKIKDMGFLALVALSPVKEVEKMSYHKHSIVFARKDAPIDTPFTIFECNLSLFSRAMIINDLIISSRVDNVVGEKDIYAFSDWLFGVLPTWAAAREKRFLRVHTCLPHCTELFIKHNYMLRRIRQTDKEDSFVGILHIDSGFNNVPF